MYEPQDLQNFDRKDIIAFESQLFKVEQLFEDVKAAFNSNDVGYSLYHALKHQQVPINARNFSEAYQEEQGEWWFTEGGECEVLRPGSQGWKKGGLGSGLKQLWSFVLMNLKLTQKSLHLMTFVR